MMNPQIDLTKKKLKYSY